MQLGRLQQDLDSFETQQGQQVNFMKRNFPEVATAWEWVQENQDKFEKEVFGPPMISCSVKDERYSDQIQSLLQMDDFTCFTAQTKNDYKKLSDQLYRNMSLSVVIRSCPHALANFQRPVSPEETKTLGLDGFAIDFLDGPDAVLAMLCSEKRLNSSGVSLDDHSDDQYERIVNSIRISQWAAGKQSYTVRRRKEYGPQAMTTITKNIQPGRFWTSQPVDSQEKVELTRQMNEKRGEKDLLRTENNELKEKLTAIAEQKREINKKIDELRSEKNALQRDFQKYQSLPDKIESEERQKASHEQAMRSAREKLHDLQFEWDEACLDRMRAALSHHEAISLVRSAHHALLEAKICLIEAQSDVAGLKERNASIVERLDLEKENVRLAAAEAASTREAGRILAAEVQDVLLRDESKRDLLTELSDGKTPSDMEVEIDAERAQLELIHAANPNVIREFEKRALEITRLQRKIEDSNTQLAELTAEIAGIMRKWEPQLDELMAKINDAFAYNFEQISCAGEVRVDKTEDFDNWALDIMVRFRENETLQKLTAHRQSGGERAVSTIFFLMALQSMAQSPFRVVDEINQGMDPRNERMVHERMVEIACREHTSQYFLITPKLLTGLKYDPKMRVLCIASGELMPREGRKVDFRRCLQRIQRGLTVAA